ncbi:hypothetical protein ACF0H5_000051 [Mactra antiquata]
MKSESVLILCICVELSFQLQPCEISSGISRDLEINETISALDNCMEGVISWHYPRDELEILFPRSVVGSDIGRKRMKVCFQGALGQGVSGIQQTRTNRRGKKKTYNLQDLKEDGSFTCTRPTRDSDGISITLLAEGPTRYYLQMLQYKVEVIEKKEKKFKMEIIGKKKDRKNKQGRKNGGKRDRKRKNKNRKVSSADIGSHDQMSLMGRPKYPVN